MPGSLDSIRARLAEQLGIDIETISAESNIIDDLGADSLDSVELIMALEDEYGLTIETEDAEKLLTVGDVAAFVDNWVG